jgi:hypothetical protein
MTGGIVPVWGRGGTRRDSLEEVSYDAYIMGKSPTQRRSLLAVCMVLAGMLRA